MIIRVFLSILVFFVAVVPVRDSHAQFEIGSLDEANGSGSSSSSDISSKAEDLARKEEAGAAPNRDTIDYQGNLLQSINEPALSRVFSDDSGAGSSGDSE